MNFREYISRHDDPEEEYQYLLDKHFSLARHSKYGHKHPYIDNEIQEMKRRIKDLKLALSVANRKTHKEIKDEKKAKGYRKAI